MEELLLRSGQYVIENSSNIGQLSPGDVIIRNKTTYVVTPEGNLMSWNSRERCFMEQTPEGGLYDMVLRRL